MRKQERLVWVAYEGEEIRGYVTLKWDSTYAFFYEKKIPEIKDLNVLPLFRRHGIGSKLLETAENEAQHKSKFVGIGVGLYQDYGEAQKLYIKRGYVPDGQGITYQHRFLSPGANAPLDDELILWLIKRLR